MFFHVGESMLGKDTGNRTSLFPLSRTAVELGFFQSKKASSDTCFLITC